MLKEFLNAKVNKTYVNARTGETSHRTVVNGKYAKMNKTYNVMSTHFGFIKNLANAKIAGLTKLDLPKTLLMLAFIPELLLNLYEVFGLPSMLNAAKDPVLMQQMITSIAYVAIIVWCSLSHISGMYFRLTIRYTNKADSYQPAHRVATTKTIWLVIILVIVKIFL